MAEDHSLEKISSARKLLKSSMECSKAIGSSLEKTGSQLNEMHRRFPSLEAAINPRRLRFSALGSHLDHVIPLASAILSILGSLHELKRSILSSDQCSDHLTCILTINRLQELLKFLGNSCNLAIRRLEEIHEHLGDSNELIGQNYVLKVEKCIQILRGLLADGDEASAPGGLLSFAIDRLETRFKIALGDAVISENIGRKLKSSILMLHANNRQERCLSCYIEARSAVAQRSIEALGLDYLERPISESDDALELGGYIDLWIKHLVVAANDVLEYERTLCHQMFETAVGGFPSQCFAIIASKSKIIDLIKFGLRITKCKKNPNKLLKLLDMFRTLDSLRLQFNKLFPSDESSEIRALTRDLVTSLIDEASEVFLELHYQVKVQRHTPAPPGGGIPPLLCFVIDYLNKLLGSHYKPILKKVLEIHQSWKHEEYREELLVGQVYSILREIAVNLDSWSKLYQDKVLCYIFMMNNHSYFGELKGTEVGLVTGDKWLDAHDGYRDYYAALYLRESFGRLQGLLGHSKGKSKDPDVIEKALVVFDEAIDQTIKKQSGWVVANEVLRQKICQLAVQALLPAYKRCLQTYTKLQFEEENYESERVSQRVGNLEVKLRSLFQKRVTKHGNTRNSYSWGAKINEQRKFQVALTAT